MTKPTHCIITGGGSGLGLGLAKRFLGRGYTVSVLDLSFGDDARLQLDRAQNGGSWHAYTVDMRDAAAVAEVVSQAAASQGPIVLAINCAGIILNKRLTETEPEAFARVIDVNLNGSMYFAKAALAHMVPGSRLALVASMAGLVSNYAYAAYGASKFGVVGLATTLRYEYESQGIAISCICPPEVKTPMVASERANGDPISLKLKDIAGSLDTETALDGIMQGLDAGQWMIIPGARSRLTAVFARHCPSLFNGFMQRNIRRLLREEQAGAK